MAKIGPRNVDDLVFLESRRANQSSFKTTASGSSLTKSKMKSPAGVPLLSISLTT